MKQQFRSLVIGSSVGAVIIALCAFILVLLVTGKLGGPTKSQAFADIFGRERPSTVSNMRYEYFSHSKGYGYYLSFTVHPQDLNSLFDADDATPLFIDGVLVTDLWSALTKFEELHDGKLPDLKRAKIKVETKPGLRNELVMEPSTNQMFCFYLVDADINKE